MEKADKQTILAPEYIPAMEKALQECGLKNVTPTNEGVISIEDFVLINKVVLKALISIAKTIQQPHTDRRRELLRAKDDKGYVGECQ